MVTGIYQDGGSPSGFLQYDRQLWWSIQGKCRVWVPTTMPLLPPQEAEIVHVEQLRHDGQ